MPPPLTHKVPPLTLPEITMCSFSRGVASHPALPGAGRFPGAWGFQHENGDSPIVQGDLVTMAPDTTLCPPWALM